MNSAQPVSEFWRPRILLVQNNRPRSVCFNYPTMKQRLWLTLMTCLAYCVDKSPNFNAYAEPFFRSIKEECLSKLILSSETQLRHVLSKHPEYYHHKRIHQGIDRIIDPRYEGRLGDIICIERLGRPRPEAVGSITPK